MRRPIAIAAIGSMVLGGAVSVAAAPTASASSAASVSSAAAAAPVLAMSDNDGLAVHNGVLYGWGANVAGELGDGTTTARPTPVRVLGGAMAVGVKVAQLSTNVDHTLAVGSDGKAYAWGQNIAGQLGDGGTTSTQLPVQVAQGAVPAGVKIVKVMSGPGESWELAGNGKAYAWGIGGGFLGDGSTSPEQDTPVAVAQGQVPSGVRIVDIAASEVSGDVVLLGGNGKLYVFGQRNNAGQLGRTDTSFTAATPVAVPAGAIPAGVKIVQVGAGSNGFAALGSNGKVYGWGQGVDGQFGNGTTLDHSATPVAAKQGAIPAGVKLVRIAVLDQTVIALGGNGKLYAWGDNMDGELGIGSLGGTRTTPVAVRQGAVPAGVRPVAVAGHGNSVLVAGGDGNLYAWGDNSSHEIGDGTLTNRSVPNRVAVPGIDTRTTLAVTGTRVFARRITLSARVIPGDAAGSVRFLDGATVLGTVHLASGAARLTTIRQKAGRQTLSAVFVPASGKFATSRTAVSVRIAKATLKAGTVRVTGVARVGRVLTAKPGAWTAGTRFAFQWLANGHALARAHARTLRLTSALRGKKIRVLVTGTKPGFATVSRMSAPTRVVTR